MGAIPPKAAPRRATGRVDDVFQIASRGLVVAVRDREGEVQIGDTLVVGAATTPVEGIQMISPRRPADIRPDTVAVLVTDVHKPALLSLVGHELTFHRPEAL